MFDTLEATTTSTTEATPAAPERSADFTAFMMLARRRALLAQRTQGNWPTPLMNQTLAKLGLEPKQEQVLEVPVTVTYMYRYTEVPGGSTAQQEAERFLALNGAAQWEHVRYEPVNEGMVVAGEAKVSDTPGVDGIEPDPAALGTDLDAYKRLVRTTAFAVAKDRGWCDAGLNEHLGALGLPLKQVHYVPVEAQVAQRVNIAIDEATSAEEARQMVEAGDPRLNDLVRAQLGSTVSLIAAKPADLNNVRPGDPNPFPQGVDRQCRSYNPASPDGRLMANYWTCTAPRGHDHQHIASNGRRVLATWTGDDSATVQYHRDSI